MKNVFHLTGWLEGASYLFLLLIAMPLKYIWDKPEMVRYVGMAHGILFLAYIGVAFAMYDKYDWSIKKLSWAVAASFLPFGPFVFEAKSAKIA